MKCLVIKSDQSSAIPVTVRLLVWVIGYTFTPELPIFNQMNPLLIFTTYFIRISSNIILQFIYTPWSSESLYSGVPFKIVYAFLFRSTECHMSSSVLHSRICLIHMDIRHFIIPVKYQKKKVKVKLSLHKSR